MKAKVTSDSCLIRFFPGGTVAAHANKGTVLDVTEEDGDWARINYYDTERYVLTKEIAYLSPGKKAQKARVVVPALNVRQTPNGTKVGKVHLNDMVDVMEQGEGWSKIEFHGSPAWLSNDYLEFVSEGATPEVIAKGTLTISGLNVRSKPGGDKLGVVRQDETLNILSESKGWYEIEFKGKSGFVYGKYVKVFKALVKPNKLNVRDKPGGQIVGTLEKDDMVNYFVDEGGWLKIRFEGQTAWVDGSYLEKRSGSPVRKPQEVKKYIKDDTRLHKLELSAVKKIQADADQPERTISFIWNEYGNIMQELSDKLHIDVASAVAIFSIESGGHGFWKDGHCLIRFETHVFHKFWGKDNQGQFDAHFKFNPQRGWTGQAYRAPAGDGWTDLHTGSDAQRHEWEALGIARKLNNDAALRSMSMGAPQILGSNYARIGYSNVQEMFESFNNDIRFHIFGFFDFLSDEMMKHIRDKDYKAFARDYNGAGNATHYGKKIKEYDNLFKKLR